MMFTDFYHGPVSGRAQSMLRQFCSRKGDELLCTLTATNNSETGSQAAKDIVIHSNFVKELKEKDECRVNLFEAEIRKIGYSQVSEKFGQWLNIKVQVDGILPAIYRELIVNPVTLRCLHDQVLSPALGWKNNYHGYAFRKILFAAEGSEVFSPKDIQAGIQAMKEGCWIGPKVSHNEFWCVL